MKTKIIKEITPEALAAAGEIIRTGGLVAFPTETVYGLGANALDDAAVKKIYAAKGRPSDNPLIVHLSDVSEIPRAAREIPPAAKKLLDRFAPGPFTLILKKQPGISDTVTAGLDTVGVRIPSDETARAFIRAAGVPIAAPSANLSGKPSPTEASDVIEDMDGRIDAIICGGASRVGVESTIIDVTGEIPTILRPGGITLEDVIEVCGEAQVDPHVLKAVSEDEKPKCPGMKYKHYAPDAEVTVIEGGKAQTAEKIKELALAAVKENKKIGIFAEENPGICGAEFIPTGENNRTLASRLFAALREFDRRGAETVYVQLCREDGYLLAVKNRLYRAAAGRVIYLPR